MTTDVSVENWEQCEQKIRLIEERHGSKQPGVWFRGHSDSDWELLSTLERRSQGMTVSAYYELARQISPEIEALAGTRLEMPAWEDVDRLSQLKGHPFDVLRLGYSFMAHLRHHGFPSPLLDWTASPYVAAYFAFAGALKADYVAIYVYVERPKKMKIAGINEPQISALGPIVRTHPRHFRQQSRYSVCTKFDARPRAGWTFARHQAVFELASSGEQDFLWKIRVPASERDKVLSLLDRYNLNAYSLFGSEESLMETLAVRHLDIKS